MGSSEEEEEEDEERGMGGSDWGSGNVGAGIWIGRTGMGGQRTGDAAYGGGSGVWRRDRLSGVGGDSNPVKMTQLIWS